MVDSLVKMFRRGVRALDGVSFQVPAESVFALLGPNGAGKTTTVQVLATLLAPDSGRVVAAGVDVVAGPVRARAVMAMAGQYAAVDEGLTGLENLLLLGRLSHVRRAERRERAEQLVTQFGLSEAAGRVVKTYSGGMRRRPDLAAALVARPAVLFLDEPTTGLDPGSRGDLWEVIGELAAGGTTILLTTQYLEEADRLADHVCVIDHERVIAEGTTSDLKSRVGGTVVEVGVPDRATAARGAEDLARVTGQSPVVDGLTVRIAATSGLATAAEVIRRATSSALDIRSVQWRQPSLDEVFLALTGRAQTPDTRTGRVAS